MVADLTDAEKHLIMMAEAGEVADYSTGESDQDNPEQGASWGAERTLRAEVVRRLCLRLNPDWPIDPKGVRVHGAKITGDLDLGSATIAFPLEMARCHVAGEIILSDATTKRLRFSGSQLLEGLNGDGVTVKGSVLLSEGFSAKGEVRLLDADIGGTLVCINGTFENPNGAALSADRMTVKGSVFLRGGFSAKGKVRLSGTAISGDLDCDNGTFENPDGDALSADGMTVKGSLFLREGFSAKGEVRLLGAVIGDTLACGNGTFESPDGRALSADRITVKGSVFLREGFSAKGEVRLPGADIGSNLECINGTFENSDDDALSADGMTVKGDVFLSGGFSAKGQVRLPGADIGGALACNNGTFENPDDTALSAVGMTVKGNVFLSEGFSAKGEVRLPGADIGSNLECINGTFENPDGDALSADNMIVKGNVFLRKGFSAKGQVRLPGADIGGNLECINGTFENPDGDALSAVGMTVKGNVLLSEGFSAKGQVCLPGADIGGDLACYAARFETNQQSMDPDGSVVFSLAAARVTGVLVWRNLEILGQATFAHAKVGGLFDDRNSWPDRGSLDLNGFEYDEFAFDAPASAAARIDWLKRQEPFRAQPYEQVIRVLRRTGHDRDAREVAIAKQVALRDSGLMSPMSKRWNRFLEITVAYGYKPWRALVYAIAFCVLGAGLFDLGFSTGLMSPASASIFLRSEFVESGGTWLPSAYPRFKAPVYALDVFLPIVDLHQESRWLPNMRNGWGWALWIYMWIHIMAGWVLTSVFVAALTGLIKKD
jgi:multidrug efflux pump subunit AcrA (membrane-fusion protein)